MTSWTNHLLGGQRRWGIVALIEGVGRHLSAGELSQTTDGRYRFCSAVPDYASGEPSDLWRPVFSLMPDVVAEALRKEGGVADDDASVSLALVDVADFLTAAMPMDAPPIAKLAADVNATATTLELEDKTNVTASMVLYIDGEALRVTSTSGSGGAQSVDVSRSYLSTEPRPHLQGFAVYDVSPFLAGRRMDLYALPLDADGESDRRKIGSYAIDGITWDDDFGSWMLNARAYVEALETKVPRYDDDYRQHRAYGSTRETGYGPVILLESGTRPDLARLFLGWQSEDYAWFAVENEILALAPWASPDVGQTAVRAAGESELSSLPDGGSWIRVMAQSAFRYSPGPTPATSRGSGIWTTTDDVIDLALILLTSSRHEDDGLELTNYIGARGNYSSLPPGWGAGVPAADIDWDTAEDVRARLNVRMPNFVLGKERKTVRDLLNELLAPCNVHLVFADGKLTFMLPRNPLTGEAVASIDASNILLRPGEAPHLPDLDLFRELNDAAAEVRFELGPRRTVVQNRNVNPGRNRRTVDISVPGASSADRYTWAELAQLRAWRLYRPVTRLSVAVDAALWGLVVGQYVAVTVPEAPDLETGLRGWANQQVLIDYREPRLEVPEAEADATTASQQRGCYLQLQGRAYGTRYATRRICPAAFVVDVTDSTVECSANRFTESDAPSSLPNQDVAAFQAGDVVRILNLDGTVPSGGGGTETVISVDTGTNELELSGDFSSALTAGVVIVFALADDATSEQRSNHAYLADNADLRVGDGDFLGTPFSEP